jgi:hypothetical protein
MEVVLSGPMDPKVVVGIVVAVIVYVGFLVGMITLAVRWSRKLLYRKADALRSGLDQAGATRLGERGTGGLYTGTEVEYEIAGRRVLTNAYYVSRSFVRVNLRIPGGPFPWVVIHPERALDKIGKVLGVNREVQTGDKAFDDLAYVDTIEADEPVKRLLANTETRDALRELMGLGYRAQFSAKGVEAFQVVYSLTPVDGSGAARASAAMAKIADTVPSFAGETLKSIRIAPRVVLGLLLISPFFCGGGIAGAMAGFTQRTLDHWHVMVAFLGGGGLIWVLYLLALAMFLRGRSYSMRVLLAGAIMGLFGIVAAGGGLLLMLNQKLDSSPGTERTAVVKDRRSYKSSRTLIVESWRLNGATESFPVTNDFYVTRQVGDTVRVQEHPGAFGWPWYERLTP